jgi:hypothetical protein
MDAPALVDNGSLPLVAGSLLLVIITLIILYLKPKSSLQASLKPPKTAASLEVPSTPGKPTVRILYGTQVRQDEDVGGSTAALYLLRVVTSGIGARFVVPGERLCSLCCQVLLCCLQPLILVLVCSLQTGTAERFSKQLGNELRRKYGDAVVVEVVDIENYKAEVRLPKEKLVLFLMATYGEQIVCTSAFPRMLCGTRMSYVYVCRMCVQQVVAGSGGGCSDRLGYA